MNKTKSIKTILARMVSVVGHPMITIPLFVIVVLFSKNNFKTASYLAFLIIGCIFVPVICWMYIKSKNGSYTNFDVSDRKQRNSLFLFAIPLLIIVTSILFLTHQSHNTCITLLFATFLVIISHLVNFYIKSSLHVSFTLFLAFLSIPISPIFGYSMMGFSLLIGWSRIVLKRHTLKEVIVGYLIGLTIGAILFYFVTLKS
jgi:membrane-associated phospholipid phosphatase